MHNYRKGNPGMGDLSGHRAFFKDETGQIFHTYSIYGRGEEDFLGIYRYLEVSPMGRNEAGPYHSLADWGAAETALWQGRHGRRQWPVSCRWLRLRRP